MDGMGISCKKQMGLWTTFVSCEQKAFPFSGISGREVFMQILLQSDIRNWQKCFVILLSF